jgi:hypothetical protein
VDRLIKKHAEERFEKFCADMSNQTFDTYEEVTLFIVSMFPIFVRFILSPIVAKFTDEFKEEIEARLEKRRRTDLVVDGRRRRGTTIKRQRTDKEDGDNDDDYK